MTAPLVTLVEGTPESCRTTATELGKLGDGVHDVGTGLRQVRGESESCWTGEAGENFRRAMQEKGAAADDLDEATSRAKAALETFADELQSVIARMKQAREVASEHGLTLTPTTIEPPRPPPPEPGLKTDGPSLNERPLHDFEAAAKAKADHERKVRGFEEAKATVADARSKEQDAHKALEASMKYETGFLQYMINGAIWNIEGIARGSLTTPQGMADTFSKRADMLYERAAKANSAIDAAGVTPAGQAAKASQRDKLLQRSTRHQGEAVKSQKTADRLYGRTGLDAKGARVLGKTAKGVPVVGTAIAAGVQVEAVVNDGKPVGKAGFNLAGGAAGGILAGAVAGACVGGPVGAVVGVGVAAIGSGLGSWGAEKLYDGITEDGG
ncbi:hypothetical protein GCM10027271_25300 [Saccharopolyspora gloriosae]|uniref:Uncharacterized protein YukE n=1 Tax=Saccharopolyspora gloriosae TaxID=455344 RepID=A0A840NR99_9PSEU|nr:WXG100 family type VII secretion target [Saccharopolyspora gloriosae]MBB5071632.1 uncharacterized protein YukE [Saccharopolyspora gloriosae]